MNDNRPLDGPAGQAPLLSRVEDDVREADKRAGRADRLERERVILRREELFPLVERENEKLLVYHTRFDAERAQIEDRDIPAVTSLLQPLGTPQHLALMIHSPGGLGEVAEKIVDICRSHATEDFSVIVPGKAKSAATLISLGADYLLMGYSSELGPTDPQVPLFVGGGVRYVSAFSVVQARRDLLEQVTSTAARGEELRGLLTQLSTSTMEPAFIAECERMIAFSYDFASKSLRRWMLRRMHPDWDNRRLGTVARRVANNFLSSHQRFSHGRMIGAQECIDIGLDVNLLAKEDARWLAIQELHARCDAMLSAQDVNKVIMTRDAVLYG